MFVVSFCVSSSLCLKLTFLSLFRRPDGRAAAFRTRTPNAYGFDPMGILLPRGDVEEIPRHTATGPNPLRFLNHVSEGLTQADLRKSPQYLLVILQRKTTVSTNLRNPPQNFCRNRADKCQSPGSRNSLLPVDTFYPFGQFWEVDSAGATCVRPLIERRFSSKVANHVTT